MERAHIRLTYSGPALEANTMDVHTLAPALLAFGDLCEEAGRNLFGKETKTRVEVRATFKTGSFGIDLCVATHLMQQIMDLLSGDTATAVSNGKTLLDVVVLGAVAGTGGLTSLVKLIKWINGRRVSRVETKPDGRLFIMEDGDSRLVEERIVLLYTNRTVRTNLQKVVAPLELEGIEGLAFGDDDHIADSIDKKEAPFFRAPEAQDILISESTSRMVFSILSLSFKEDNKWRLHDGQNAVYVSIADAEFNDRVNKNVERFAKNDLLIAETKRTYWQTLDGLRSDYAIQRVLEHRAAEMEIPLPGMDCPAPDGPKSVRPADASDGDVGPGR